MSLEMIAASICKAYCLEGTMKTFSELFTTLIVGFAGLSLFLAAIEFPLFLSYGREKAMYGKIVFGTVIGLILIGYVLFGDVSVFENIDIFKFVDWLNAHQTEMMVVSTFGPVLVLLIYYGSYQLSCKLVDRKEA